jgi:hypothetical protein
MARKPGDMGMLGLTEQQKDMSEFVGIKKEDFEKEPPKSWGESFKDKTNAAWDKVKNFNKLELTTIDFGRHDKKEENLSENQEEITEPVEENKEISELPAEEAVDSIQAETEQLEGATLESSVEGEDGKEEVQQEAEQLKTEAETKLDELKSKLEAVDQSAEKLSDKIAQLEQQIEKINRLMEGKGEAPSNVVDMQDWKKARSRRETGSEMNIEQQELEGDAAVAATLNRYGGEYIQNTEGLEWLQNKFEDSNANGADATIALSVLKQYRDDRESGAFGENVAEMDAEHPVNVAINHLEEQSKQDESWKQPEGVVSDWVEAQAHLRGPNEQVDTKLLGIAEKLRSVSDGSNSEQLLNAQHSLEGLKKDKDFWQQFDVDTIGEVSDKWKELQKKLDEKNKNTRSQTYSAQAA